MDNDNSYLTCPVCFEVPTDEIFQCKNGHTICHLCANKIRNCPECRAEYGTEKIRNRALETILNQRKFNCSNKYFGCELVVPRRDITTHLKCCKYRDINICKKLEFNCKFVIRPGKSVELTEHFQNQHNSVVLEKTTGLLVLENFSDEFPNKANIWAPMFLLETDGNQNLFMTFAKTNSREQTLSLDTFCISKMSADLSDYNVQYFIPDQSSSASPLKWCTSVYGLDCLDKSSSDRSALTLSLCYLKANHASDGCLRIFTSVQDCASKRVNFSCKMDIDPFLALPLDNTDFSSTERVTSAHAVNQEAFISCNVCDSCRQRILTGSLHSCLQCWFYDLCDSCFRKGIHSHHLLAHITTYGQSVTFHRLKFNSTLKDFVPLVSHDNVVDEDLICTECQENDEAREQAAVYCLNCPKFYGVCLRCCHANRKRVGCSGHRFLRVSGKR